MDSQRSQDGNGGAISPTPNSASSSSSSGSASASASAGVLATDSSQMITDNGLIQNPSVLEEREEEDEFSAKMDTNHNSHLVDEQTPEVGDQMGVKEIEAKKGKHDDVKSETMSNGVGEEDAAMASEGDSDSLREFIHG